MNIVKRKTKVKAIINTTIERHPVPILGIDYKVKIIYKNIKITEIDVENKTIKISLPNRYKKMNNKEILDLAIDKMYEQVAKVEIERAMEKTRIMLGFAPEEYEITKMKSLGMMVLLFIPKLGWQSQVDLYNFEISLVYIGSSKTVRPCF